MPPPFNLRPWLPLLAALLLPLLAAGAVNDRVKLRKHPYTDSLLWVVNKAGRPIDPKYCAAYDEIARKHLVVANDTALYFARLSVASARLSPELEDDAEAGVSLLFGFMKNYEIDSAIALAPRVIKLGTRLGLPFIIGEANYQLSVALYYKGDYKAALSPIIKSIEALKRARNINRLALAHAHYALVFGQDGNRNEVINHYHLALDLLEQSGVPEQKALIYNNLAEIYLNGQPPRLDSALWCLRHAHTQLNISPPPNRLGVIASTFAVTFMQTHQYDSARFYQTLALDFAREEDDKELLVSVLQTQLELEQIAKNHPEVIKIGHQVYDLAEKLKLRRFQYDAVRAMGPAYAALGQYPRAIRLRKLEADLRDSLFSPQLYKEKQRLVEELETARRRQRLDQLERQRNLQQKEIDQQEFYMIVALVAAFVFAATAGFTFFTYRNLQEAQAHLKRLITYTEGQNTQLLETTRTKDKLTGIIAHDLRGPIAGLSLVPEVLDMAIAANDLDLIRHSVDDLRESTSSLSRLLESLLTWAQSQSGTLSYEPQAVDLQQVVQHTLSLFAANAAKKGLTLTADVEGPLLVQADAPSLETIIRNLVNNAVKFTRAGGSITVRARPMPMGVVQVQVIDTGIGINPQHLQSLFTPGSMHRSNGTAGERGTGLGLSLVADLVRHNRGELAVNSSPGQGSTFSITLPAPSVVVASQALPAPRRQQQLA